MGFGLLMIDQRAEHLQIGDNRIHFGHPRRVAIIIADLSLGIAPSDRRCIGIGVGLRDQIGISLFDRLFGVRHADPRQCGQMLRHIAGLDRPLAPGTHKAA